VEQSTDNEIANWLIGRIKIQGQRDTMHFELIYYNDILVGFAMYAIDLGGVRGIIESGYGYIMETYIMPDFRRKGIASDVFIHMEDTLKLQGARRIYLTPDSVRGVPFWESVGFSDCRKIDPNNNMPIYIKDVGER
jgi:Acetyltransferases